MSWADAANQIEDPTPFYGPLGPLALLLGAFLVLFMMGFLPIPIGYKDGKIKWLMWCATGMHPMRVYRTENGFQTLHPKERDSS